MATILMQRVSCMFPRCYEVRNIKRHRGYQKGISRYYVTYISAVYEILSERRVICRYRCGSNLRYSDKRRLLLIHVYVTMIYFTVSTNERLIVVQHKSACIVHITSITCVTSVYKLNKYLFDLYYMRNSH